MEFVSRTSGTLSPTLCALVTGKKNIKLAKVLTFSCFSRANATCMRCVDDLKITAPLARRYIKKA